MKITSKTTSKIVIASALSTFISQVALALTDSSKPSDYSVIALKDCEVVSDTTMTAEQLTAYLNLKQQEQKMHTLEIPLKGIEKEAKQYSDELEKLAKLAIQDTDESLFINKALLQQHDLVAEKLNQFMGQHHQDFAALGKQGTIIGQFAEKFETSIKASLEGIDYEQIQVLTPTSKALKPYCDKHIRISII